MDGFLDGDDDDDPPLVFFIFASKNGFVLDKATANGDDWNVFLTLVSRFRIKFDGTSALAVKINRDGIFNSGCISGPTFAVGSGTARSRCIEVNDSFIRWWPLEKEFSGISNLSGASAVAADVSGVIRSYCCFGCCDAGSSPAGA